MSLITLPAAFRVRSCQLRMSTNQRVSASPFGGSEQAVDMLNDRWLLSCELPEAPAADGRWREAFIESMRGQVNWVALYHFQHQAPAGTARGTQTLNASAAQGASSIQITGVSPSTGTYLAGDLVGVDGLLLRVGTDCTAVAGVITVPLANRLRKALTSGAAVTWYRPTALFRLLSDSGVRYTPSIASALSLEFGEYIA